MTKKTKEAFANNGATIAGLLVALANAWITIDWENFEFTDGNIMKLSLSGIIAMGGYFSRFKTSKKQDSTIDQ